MIESKPRLCFIGPNLGVHRGWVTTQGELQADLFESEGYPVLRTSSVIQPLLRFFDMAAFLVRRHKEIDIALISTFSGRAFLFADALGRLCRQLKLPHVLVLHGGGLAAMAEARGGRMFEVLNRADACVAPSSFLARMASNVGCAAEVIPNVLGVGEYPFQFRRELVEPVRLFWLRTFHPIYNPQMALETLSELRQRGVDATLTMAGQEKGLESECRRLADELGLKDRVRFVGFLDMEGKRREMSSHDVYLHTNRVDNMPVTVVEAAAFGLPIIATRVGGVPDLLGDRGLLVASEDASGAADAVQKLIAEPEEVARCSVAGRELAESCAWPEVQRAWDDLFSRVLAAEGRA